MFAKLKSDGTLQYAPNPIRVVIANPTDEQYKEFGYSEVVETIPPEYNPETQYLTYRYEKQGDNIVQVWTVNLILEEKHSLSEELLW